MSNNHLSADQIKIINRNAFDQFPLADQGRERIGYIAGATAEAERAQPLADLLELIKTLGPVDSLTVKLIDKKLKEWKG